MANYVVYAAGEKKCEKCGDALGEVRCTTDKMHFFCSKPECRFPANFMVPIRFIGSGERACDGPGCKNSVPPRAYPTWQRRFFCRKRCESRYKTSLGSLRVPCAYCGKKLRRSPGSKSRFHFCIGHGALYRRDQKDREKCGPFLNLFQLWVREFATIHYRDLNQPRHEVRQFFASLNIQGISDITAVRPVHISQFISWRRKTKQTPRADFVKVMFDYLVEVGKYDSPNPVRPRIHYTPSPETEPRPYDSPTRANIWKWLEERGDTRAKLIVAFGDEFGPRSKEVCNIRLQDLDLIGRRIWIRNPTKNNVAGWVPYSKNTEKWLNAWLQERDPECPHDYLLTNFRGDPLRTYSLRDLLNGILRKKSKFRRYEEGLEKFSYHALRHSNATDLQRNGVDAQVNMKIHRWKSPASVQRYAKIFDEQAAEQYTRAMERVVATEQQNSSRTAFSMAEFLASRRKPANGGETPDGV